MDKALRQKLADLYQELQAYDAQQSNRLDKWRNSNEMNYLELPGCI